MIRKDRNMAQDWIWQHPEWPAFRVDSSALATALARARREQGRVLGLLHAIGFEEAARIASATWAEEAVATAAIEGQALELAVVRSSVMRRLGTADENDARASRHVDGLLDVMQDAIGSFPSALDHDRLQRWQSALFPGGTSGIRPIAVGKYREGAEPMQIVSGPIGREVVHYTAPAAAAVPAQMNAFLRWWEETRPGEARGHAQDGMVRAAISHLWFETIHPFEDGNGRIGRALVDMALAQDAQVDRQFYGVARQLLAVRKDYYAALNTAQRGTLDVTAWVAFFLEQLAQACLASQVAVEAALEKNRFWAAHRHRELSDRQRKALTALLDAGKGGFEGGMRAEKYANLTGTSKATATRDLTDLAQAGLLVTTGQGRATRYWINLPGWAG